MRYVFQAHPAQQLVAPLGPSFTGGRACVLQRQFDVAPDTAPREQTWLLEHHAGGLARHRATARHLDLATGRGGFESGDQSQQGALAASRCADENKERAGLDVEVDGPECRRLSVAVFDAADLESARVVRPRHRGGRRGRPTGR